ncbi:MAG: site-2 protease family protein [Gammaproteobacteria bacterium]|jgi:Zn-dependent protease|nr:site-2 protease family protein [Gammaproteobacteria bacterium]
MEDLTLLQRLAVLILPVVLAITVHEAAHGYVADRLGDRTARLLGRVTLNPLRHIDPLGTVLIPLGMYALTGFLFGWAKPVPVNPRNLANPRRGMAVVAVAGPLSNLAMALLWSLALVAGKALLPISSWVGLPLLLMGAAGVLINVILLVLNMIPLPPLDGGRVLVGVLPRGLARVVAQVEPYGLFILVALLVSGLLGRFVTPFVVGAIDLLPGSSVVLSLFFN